MIKEWIKYILSPATPVVKKAGYLHEAIAIESRHDRARKAWLLHINETRNNIISFVKKYEQNNCVMIAGAGSLHDVPVDFLASRFGKVILLDIVFTRRARSIAKQYANVELHEHDLSGIKNLQQLVSSAGTLPETGKPELPGGLPEPDMFLSVNLLSQLPVTPRVCLEKPGLFCEHDLDRWCKRLIENQILFMRQMKYPVCLVSDYRHRVYDKHDRLLQKTDMLYGVPPGKQHCQWEWSLAPQGELGQGYRIMADVGCWHM